MQLVFPLPAAPGSAPIAASSEPNPTTSVPPPPTSNPAQAQAQLAVPNSTAALHPVLPESQNTLIAPILCNQSMTDPDFADYDFASGELAAMQEDPVNP